MAFDVHYDTPAGPAAQAAYLGGYGQFRQRQAEINRDQANRDRALAIQVNEAAKDRQFQQQQADRNFALNARQQAQQADIANQRTLMQAVAQQADQQQNAQALAQRQQQAEQQALQTGLANGTLAYSNADTLKIKELRNSWSTVQQDQTLRPRDRQRAQAEIQQQLQSIMPQPVLPGERQLSAQDMVQQNVVFANGQDAKDGQYILNPKTGGLDWKPPRNVAPDPAIKAKADAEKAAAAAAEKQRADEAKRVKEEQTAIAAAAKEREKEIKERADEIYKGTVADLAKEDKTLSPEERYELWRKTYKAVKEAETPREAAADGTPAMPVDVKIEMPERIRKLREAEALRKNLKPLMRDFERLTEHGNGGLALDPALRQYILENDLPTDSEVADMDHAELQRWHDGVSAALGRAQPQEPAQQPPMTAQQFDQEAGNFWNGGQTAIAPDQQPAREADDTDAQTKDAQSYLDQLQAKYAKNPNGLKELPLDEYVRAKEAGEVLMVHETNLAKQIVAKLPPSKLAKQTLVNELHGAGFKTIREALDSKNPRAVVFAQWLIDQQSAP